MSLPDNTLSSQSIVANFTYGFDRIESIFDTIDYEMGGLGINDPTNGLDYQLYTAQLYKGQVLVHAPYVDQFVMMEDHDITGISLSFDQNMRPALLYVKITQAYLWWYDTAAAEQVTTTLDADVITPKIIMDDRRASQSNISDIILAYVRSGNLYYRQQRDRFNTEYLLYSGIQPGVGIKRFGTNSKLRLQFHMGIVDWDLFLA